MAIITRPDLDSTIAALQGGLTCISWETAGTTLDYWQEQLAGTELAQHLAELKTALREGNAEGSLTRLLLAIGKATTDAANREAGDTAAKLEQLGHLLSRMGQSFD